MACLSCLKRGKLIGAAIKAVSQNKPVAPIVRGLGRTIVNDVRRLSGSAPVNPRLGTYGTGR